MTRLKKMMLEELQLRNYARNTVRHYLRAVEDFARHFNCSPDRLGPRHIREYQAELFEKRKLSANSVGQHLAALRFFYIKTLRKAWSLAETPYPKKARRLPTILSREEVAQLLHAARTPGKRILLMTLYATGARNSELTHLKVSDIDSQRMVVHIRSNTRSVSAAGLIGGFRWTISKQGLGGSWGLGGILRLGVSPDGRRYVSVRIPGTGISWVKYYGQWIAPVGAGNGTPRSPLPAPSSPQTAGQNPVQSPAASQPWWKQKMP